jgi:hypothetical protein
VFHCVVEVRVQDVSKDCSAFIFRVKLSKIKYLLELCDTPVGNINVVGIISNSINKLVFAGGGGGGGGFCWGVGFNFFI